MIKTLTIIGAFPLVLILFFLSVTWARFQFSRKFWYTRILKQGLVAIGIGYSFILVGIGLIMLHLAISNIFGAMLIVMGYQIILWAVGIRSEFLGNVHHDALTGKETDMKKGIS